MSQSTHAAITIFFTGLARFRYSNSPWNWYL